MILALYAQRPTIVDDDAKLQAGIWHNLGWDYTATLYENLRKMPRAESITRARRTLHEKGLIKYSPEVEAKRYKKYIEITAEKSDHSMDFIATDHGQPVVIDEPTR